MFLQNKYTNWYFSIINKRQASPATVAIENHHIIPESFYKKRKRKGPAGWLAGNPDALENIVALTGREHFICHRLLTKMVDGVPKAKMVHALSFMLSINNTSRTYRITSRVYQSLRLLMTDIMKEEWTIKRRQDRSKLMKGSLNHFYGKQHSDETKEKMRNRIVSESTKLLISKTQKDRYTRSPGTFLGKHHTEETKEKLRQKHLGRKDSDETKLKKSIAGKNKPPTSIEARRKISEKNKGKNRSGILNGFYGKIHSADQRQRKSNEKQNAPKQLCEFCNKLIDPMNYGRWHGQKCKYK